jgi:hypothetical protein
MSLYDRTRTAVGDGVQSLTDVLRRATARTKEAPVPALGQEDLDRVIQANAAEISALRHQLGQIEYDRERGKSTLAGAGLTLGTLGTGTAAGGMAAAPKLYHKAYKGAAKATRRAARDPKGSTTLSALAPLFDSVSMRKMENFGNLSRQAVGMNSADAAVQYALRGSALAGDPGMGRLIDTMTGAKVKGAGFLSRFLGTNATQSLNDQAQFNAKHMQSFKDGPLSALAQIVKEDIDFSPGRYDIANAYTRAREGLPGTATLEEIQAIAKRMSTDPELHSQAGSSLKTALRNIEQGDFSSKNSKRLLADITRVENNLTGMVSSDHAGYLNNIRKALFGITDTASETVAKGMVENLDEFIQRQTPEKLQELFGDQGARLKKGLLSPEAIFDASVPRNLQTKLDFSADLRNAIRNKDLAAFNAALRNVDTEMLKRLGVNESGQFARASFADILQQVPADVQRKLLRHSGYDPATTLRALEGGADTELLKELLRPLKKNHAVGAAGAYKVQSMPYVKTYNALRKQVPEALRKGRKASPYAAAAAVLLGMGRYGYGVRRDNKLQERYGLK